MFPEQPLKNTPKQPKKGLRNLIAGMLELVREVVSYVVLKIADVVMSVVQFLIDLAGRGNERFVKFSKALQVRSGSYFSQARRSQVGMMVVHAGLTKNPEEVLGVALIYSVMISIASMFIVAAVGGEYMPNINPVLRLILAAVVPFAAIWLLFYLVFIILIERRTGSVERVLPDVLTIISQNMVAGMTVYNALWVAARPEFGPLAVEIQTVAKETLGGEAFDKSLMNMSNRVKSYKLARSVKLIIQGMRSGGELPTVLQEIATDIRTEQNLFKRMSSETTAQALFILFALVVGAPLLFAASLQFVTIFNNIYEKIGLDKAEAAAVPRHSGMVSLQKLPITAEFFWWYAVTTLTVSGAFGALLIGLIRTGKLSSGIPLVPVVVVLSVAVFIAITMLLSSVFKGMMGV